MADEEKEDPGTTYHCVTADFDRRWMLMRDFAQDNDHLRLAIRDGYLEPWTRYEPLERLREACALVCRPNRWYEGIRWNLERPHLEPGSPWGLAIDHAPPWCLRNALEMMEADGEIL